MDPEDRVDRCAGRLFGKDVVMLVCAHCVEREEGHEEQAVGVPAHYGRELRRMYGELERTAAGCALSHNLGPTMSGAVRCTCLSLERERVTDAFVRILRSCSLSFTSYGPSAVIAIM